MNLIANEFSENDPLDDDASSNDLLSWPVDDDVILDNWFNH